MFCPARGVSSLAAGICPGFCWRERQKPRLGTREAKVGAVRSTLGMWGGAVDRARGGRAKAKLAAAGKDFVTVYCGSAIETESLPGCYRAFTAAGHHAR